MSEIAIAFNRFGLGTRVDDSPPADARRWLTAQLERFDPRPAPIAAVPTRAALVAELADYLEEFRRDGLSDDDPPRRPRRPQATMTTPPATPDMDDATAGLPDSVRRYVRRAVRDHYLNMVAARTSAALTAPAPFVERLVHFWANHFAVSADKLPVIGLSGLLEFEAIRPHVLGRFRDMLVAVEQHPAMLLYLDQAQSIGPNSRGGRLAARFARQRRGLNENLAREVLELHTLGVDGGYGQADVTELARALTGWTVSGLARGPARRLIGSSGAPGSFLFAGAIHEPGTRTLLSRTYRQEGEAQARAILDDLAAHPATARHLATKLARHFAGDEPPPAMVERLSRAYQDSGGDLPTVYRAIIDSPEAWRAGAGQVPHAVGMVDRRPARGRRAPARRRRRGRPARPARPAGVAARIAGRL